MNLSALDARFACLCGGASSAHSIGAGLAMRCEHCRECEGYRPTRCVCHLTRDDGKPIRCYADSHGEAVVPNRHPAVDSFWKELAAARDEQILQEAGPNPGPEYVLIQDGRYRWADKHAGHMKGSYAATRSRCPDCFEKRVRRGLGNKDVFRRQAAEKAAERYGVTP